MKFLAINIIKMVNGFDTEKYKTLPKEIEEILSKWKDILCSCTERLDIVKVSVLLKVLYKFSAILIKNPTASKLLKNYKTASEWLKSKP